MKRITVVLLAISLGGCFGTGSEKPEAAAAVVPAPKCPERVAELPEYAQSLQRQVAGEMRAAGPNAAWPRLVSDWIYKRQQIRSLCK